MTNKESEAEIVRFRTRELLRRHHIELDVPPTLLDILLQSFADLRAVGRRGRQRRRELESALSTAEQIGVLEDAILHSTFFGDGALSAETLAGSLVGSLARRSPEDLAILNKYWHGVVEARSSQGRRAAYVAGSSWRAAAEAIADLREHPCDVCARSRPQLLAAAAAFADGPAALAGILAGLVDDVDRAVREPLEIFPVCHHSPASALRAWSGGSRAKQPKVIYLELLRGPAGRSDRLRNCRLPVALQAFASESDASPPVAPAEPGRADHRSLGGVPGDRLRPGHARRRTWSSWTAPPTTSSSGRAPASPTRTAGPVPGAGRAAGRRRGGDCTATRSASRSATCGRASPIWSELPAAPRPGPATGRSGGTSMSSSRSPTPTTTPTGRSYFLVGSLFRRLGPADADRTPGRGPRAVHVDPDAAAPRPPPAPTRRTASTSAAPSTPPAACRVRRSTPPRRTFEITPGRPRRWHLRADPVQPLGHRARSSASPRGTVSIAAATWRRGSSSERGSHRTGRQGRRAPRSAASARPRKHGRPSPRAVRSPTS